MQERERGRRDALGQIGEINMEPTRLAYTISEACALTSLGRTTLYLAIKSGELKTHKVGRRTLITKKELVAWLDSRPAAPISTPAGTTHIGTDIANKAVRS